MKASPKQFEYPVGSTILPQIENNESQSNFADENKNPIEQTNPENSNDANKRSLRRKNRDFDDDFNEERSLKKTILNERKIDNNQSDLTLDRKTSSNSKEVMLSPKKEVDWPALFNS